MLARLTLVLAAAPLVAFAAAAPVDGGKITVPPPAAAAPAPTTPATPQFTPIAAPPTQDPAECRTGCAQTYYFCRAGEQPDTCGDAWSQCVATCNTPSLNPGASAVR